MGADETGAILRRAPQKAARFNGSLFENPRAPAHRDQIALLSRPPLRLADRRARHLRHAARTRARSRRAPPARRALHAARLRRTPRHAHHHRAAARRMGGRAKPPPLTLDRGKSKTPTKPSPKCAPFIRALRIRVLDPACGSGNFLYVTLEHLKRLEGEVSIALDPLGHAQALARDWTASPSIPTSSSASRSTPAPPPSPNWCSGSATSSGLPHARPRAGAAGARGLRAWTDLAPLMQIVNGNAPATTTRDDAVRELDERLLERLVALNPNARLKRNAASSAGCGPSSRIRLAPPRTRRANSKATTRQRRVAAAGWRRHGHGRRILPSRSAASSPCSPPLRRRRPLTRLPRTSPVVARARAAARRSWTCWWRWAARGRWTRGGT